MENRNNYFNNEKYYPLVAQPIGVGPVVSAPLGFIREMQHDFADVPESMWTDGKGIGKEYILERFIEDLLTEGQYFSANLDEATIENKRFFWYMYNWVAYIVLYSMVHQEPIIFPHPSAEGAWGNKIPDIEHSRALLREDRKGRVPH